MLHVLQGITMLWESLCKALQPQVAPPYNEEEGQILGWSSRWPMLEGGFEEAKEFLGCIGSGQK